MEHNLPDRNFKGVLKSDDDIVIENKYPSVSLYINSFDVTYNEDIIGEEGVSIPSNRAVTFDITNIMPLTATLDYDPLILYIRTETRDIELNMEPTSNSYKMIGFFNRTTNQPTINAQYAGEVTLVLKTKGGLFEKEIKLNFEKSAPTSIRNISGICSFRERICSMQSARKRRSFN